MRLLISSLALENKSNKYYFRLTEFLNFFVVEALTGVSFQYGAPQKAMIKISTRLITDAEIHLPILMSSKIKYNYHFPEVLLNFSKILLKNETKNTTENMSGIDMNHSIPDFGRDGADNFSNLSKNNSKEKSPVQYKIIIAQDYLYLSIVSKCGSEAFDNIPKKGSFQQVNPYYKEYLADYALNFSDFIRPNLKNSSNKTFEKKNETDRENINETKPMDNDKQEEGTKNSSNTGGFLKKNDSVMNESNLSAADDTNNFTDISSLGLKPFTLYDDGNELKLVVNLDARDYYFITALAYSSEHNDTYFYYDTIHIKDSRFGDEPLMDFGIIMISK